MKRTVAAITVDDLAFAIAVGDAAYRRKSPRPSLRGAVRIDTDNATLRLTDHPMNAFMMAILDAFSHAPERAEAAVLRCLWVGRDSLRDPRAEPYLHRQSGGALDVHRGLLEAIATVPLVYGGPSPLDDVFELASQIRKRLEPAPEPA